VQLESLRAATDAKEITFKVAYGLPLSEQQRWGLYVSEPRNIRETDQPFPEPALLLLNPDGELVIVDVSNSPFARPDLRILVEGVNIDLQFLIGPPCILLGCCHLSGWLQEQ
jgi:hypothetical protein